MKKWLLTLACVLACQATAAAGSWVMSFPVNGMSCKGGPTRSSEALAAAIHKHFATLKDDAGRPLLINVQAEQNSGLVNIYMDCPARGVTYDDIVTALKGTPFFVTLEDWQLGNNVGLAWRTDKAIAPAQLREMEAAFARMGKNCTSARIESRGVERGFEHSLLLAFEKEGGAPAQKIIAELKSKGYMAAPVFLKGDRSGAVVRWGPPLP